MNNPPRKRKKSTSTSNNSQSAVNPDIPSQENQSFVTIDVAAIEVPELTDDEQRDRITGRLFFKPSSQTYWLCKN